MAGKTTRSVKPDIKLNSYESLFGELTDEGESTDLFIKELHDFKEHPFRVTDDEDMLELNKRERNPCPFDGPPYCGRWL